MRRKRWTGAAGLALVGALALTGSLSGMATAAPEHNATKPSDSKAAQLAWLNSRAEPWNHKMNADQNAIDKVTDDPNIPSKRFFSNLNQACLKMLHDAGKADKVPAAPSSNLDEAWEVMIADTEVYAADCLDVTQDRTKADLTTWTKSGKTMESATAVWNTAVDVLRGKVHGDR